MTTENETNTMPEGLTIHPGEIRQRAEYRDGNCLLRATIIHNGQQVTEIPEGTILLSDEYAGSFSLTGVRMSGAVPTDTATLTRILGAVNALLDGFSKTLNQ